MIEAVFEYVYNRRDFIADYLILSEGFAENLAEYFADKYADYVGDGSEYDCPPAFVLRALTAYDNTLSTWSGLL